MLRVEHTESVEESVYVVDEDTIGPHGECLAVAKVDTIERATLFAAAPLMLATLRRIADDCDAMSWEEIRHLANIAVASAEGR